MQFEGKDRMLKRFAAIQGKPRAAIREALRQGAEELVAMQKRFAPVDSGDLQMSIRYTFGYYAPDNANVRGVGTSGAGDPDLTVHVHAGDAKAWYARIVEFGTRNQRVVDNYFGHRGVKVSVGALPANPFFYGPYRVLKKRIKSRVSRATRKAVREGASV